jgi:hypothetical protein
LVRLGLSKKKQKTEQLTCEVKEHCLANKKVNSKKVRTERIVEVKTAETKALIKQIKKAGLLKSFAHKLSF